MERESETEETSPLPFPVVPAGPVNSPTWRRRTEEERAREGLRHESEAKGRGKFAGVTVAGGGGRRQAIWVREAEDGRRDRGDEQGKGIAAKTESSG